ncbi:MAG TPA: 30S ribosome-binding factor RbfA [Pyrinomonadaceae bacterium]|mgnify:CR=1 FL=1|nr:30S ribosome-binding factor RbfA [Pyrinomonadaceae bacterium]
MRRPERLAQSLREQITEIVGYELEDPQLQNVTVTDVIVSENSREAKVFVIVDGDENEIKNALKGLQHAASYVRQQVAFNLDLNHAPHLNFVRDTVEENAVKVDALLSDLNEKGEFEERSNDE